MRVNEPFHENCDYDFLDKNVHLNIMNGKGEIYVVNLSENTTIETLKNKILSYFRKTSQWENLVSFRLISTLQKRSLQDNRTLKEEQIANNDYLIMKKKKQSSNFNTSSDKRYSTITKQQIAEATKSLPSRNVEDRFCVQSNQSNFCKDIRKILVTLVDYSEKLLRDHAKVKKIFYLANEFGSGENLNFLNDDEIDEEALRKLTEMGFTDMDKSKQALRLNNMNPINAIDWLLAYETNGANSNRSSGGGCRLHCSNESKSNDLKSNEQINDKNEIKTTAFRQAFYDKNEIYENVPKLVESYRKFKRYTFYYNKKSFDNMKKMGFDNKEVIDSLWVMKNNENLACEWLLSNRQPKINEEMSFGLLRGSPLYNSLIKNPIIQLGLLKPKVLFAFLHLLSSNFNGEQNASRWFNEAEIQPIISQIFRVYTTEKQCVNTFSVHPSTFVGHHQSRSCFSNTRSYSLDQYQSTDYSTYLIPEILSELNELSLGGETNQQRQEQNDNWNSTENSHATLV